MLREHYIAQLAEDVGVSKEAMTSKFAQLHDGAKKKLKVVIENDIEADPFSYQNQLLGLLWNYPITRRVLETIDDEPVFARSEREAVFSYIATHPLDNFDDDIPEELKKDEDYVKMITLLAKSYTRRLTQMKGCAKRTT